MSGLLYKIIFVFNSIVALLLLLGYLLPYIPPQSFFFPAVLGLFLPLLILLNLGFLLFWIITRKRYAFLSLIVLLMGYNHIKALFQWHSVNDTDDKEGFKVMSYNVRLMNRYHWIHDDSIPEKIADFVNGESPDIIGFQEYYEDPGFALEGYKYSHIRMENEKSGQALFSKWPILHKGYLDFAGSSNNAIYSDIAIGTDTLRVFNLHLESLRIDAKEGLKLSQDDGKRMARKMGQSFQRQELQIDEIVEAVMTSPYRIIVVGDFNNTPTSYIYRTLTDLLRDTFREAGRGLGRTFNFKGYPLRIDMIFVDLDIKVHRHQNYDIELSDHFPISADLEVIN